MRKRILTAAVAAATLASGAQAAGFYLKEQSVVGQGRAFAGSAAGTDGASAAYFNPAGIVGVADQIEVGVHYIKPDVTVTDNGSSVAGDTSASPVGTDSVGSRTTAKPYEGKAIPNLHLVKAINDKYTLGVAVGAPYGFSNDYGADVFNQTDHRKVDFSTIETSISLASAISSKTNWSFGLMIQQLDLEQDKKSPLSGNDVKLKGDSQDYGFVVGVQHKKDDKTTLGVSYRSQVTHTVDGTLGTTPVTAPFQLPDILAAGITHVVSDTTRVYADATWYGWSEYTSQPIKSKATNTVLSEPTSNYSNTVSFGLGVEHDYPNGITARAGLMVDPTPTNDTDRSTSTPDSDRTWLAVGLSKETSENMTFDAALTHIMADNTEVNKAIGGAGFVRGKVKGSTNIVSLGFRYKF